MPDATKVYSARATEFAQRYESVASERIHDSWLHLLPARGGVALDVGAGSGRDAAHLAGLGWKVVAVEPAAKLRREAQRLHPAPRIRWLDDSLPALEATGRLDRRFELILLSAVWQHVAPAERERAFRRLAEFLRPGGLLVISLRHGEPDRERGMYPVDAEELERFAKARALRVVALPRNEATPDAMGRAGITWTTHVFRSEREGAEAGT